MLDNDALLQMAMRAAVANRIFPKFDTGDNYLEHWRALGEVVAIVAAPLRLELDDLRQRLNSAQAERGALAARLAAIEEALAPAVEALSGATAGEWRVSSVHPPVVYVYRHGEIAVIATDIDARAIVVAVSAVRAVAAIGEEATS